MSSLTLISRRNVANCSMKQLNWLQNWIVLTLLMQIFMGTFVFGLTAAVDGTESISLQSTSQLLKKLSDLRLVELDQEGNLAE